MRTNSRTSRNASHGVASSCVLLICDVICKHREVRHDDARRGVNLAAAAPDPPYRCIAWSRIFDYLPYANYLALYEGWQFDDLTPFMNGSVPVFSLGEGGGGNDAVMQRVQPHWAYWFAYEKEPKFDWRVFMTFLLSAL